VRDGDEWIVTGQKVWTSFARDARFGMLLARTDPGQPKHSGISYFALDLSSPGVTIRPLVQMTGDTEFNEVFLQDVRVPAAAMIGPEGEGWKVAGTTLMNERVAISGSGGGFRERIGGRSVERLIAAATHPGPAGESIVDPRWRQRLSRLWIEGRVIRWTNQRAKDLRQAGQTGSDGSIGKLLQAEHNRRLQEASVDLLGARGTARDIEDHDASTAWYGFLRARANTIEGGTSEIQRNIIGERLLGLPREPNADGGRPWKDIARNG
jgi:alkylation response protein AidB-like acyl-CoA dehydrogenase